MTYTHPRRRASPQRSAANGVNSGSASTDPPKAVASLPKSSTFQASKTPPSDRDPILHVPTLPRRTVTSIDHNILNSRLENAQHLIRSVEQSLARGTPLATLPPDQCQRRALPIPGGMLDAVVRRPQPSQTENSSPTCTGQKSSGHARHVSAKRHRQQQNQNHRQAPSDSGVGSSVVDSLHAPSQACSTVSVLGRVSIVANDLPGLSTRAAHQIQERVVSPVLRQAKLGDFHPLVERIPSLLHHKQLVCLRDVEKTLLFSAEVSRTLEKRLRVVTHLYEAIVKTHAKSPELYREFCEFSIQCLVNTVDHVSEHEHCRPHDRPYTPTYFVDLVGQIREYARRMAASRQRQQKGEEGGDPDGSLSGTIRLEGGLGRTGRPAQLVLDQNGKTKPLPAGPSSEEDKLGVGGRSVVPKRSLSGQADEDLVQRSMARRRKLGPGETPSKPVRHACQSCDKVFDRQCDLTKHEKAHTRPWPCPVTSCEYHTRGWPTEKERDRHVNDKHASQPEMFSCKFPPCTYKSKRLSNCKQHMENSHNYNYVRVKGNGRKGKKQASPAASSAQATPVGPPTPRDTATPGSNYSEAPTPDGAFTARAASDDFGGGHFGNHLAGTPSSVQFTPVGMSPDASLVNETDDVMAVDPVEEVAPTADGNVEFWVNNLPQLTQAVDQQNLNSFAPCDLAPVQLPTPSQSVEHLAFNPLTFDPAVYPGLELATDADMDFEYDFPSGDPSASTQAPAVINPSMMANNFIDEGLGDVTDLPYPRNDFPLYDGSPTDMDLNGNFSLFPGPQGIGSGMSIMPPAAAAAAGDPTLPSSDPAWREFMAEIMHTDGSEMM